MSQTVLIPQIQVERVSLAPPGVPPTRAPKKGLSLPAEMRFLLKDISFDVVQGDRIAIVGPSGAGKTSLLRLLNRLREPSSGTIYFENRALNHISPIALRQEVVLVQQESKLLGMTVQQALEYPLVLRKLPPKTIQQRVVEWTERLRIPSDWLARTELQLSLGQRQLIAIARALVTQPKVLLLDEPTSAADIGRGEFLVNVLNTLSQNDATSVLMVNHQLDLAKQFCNRILYMQQGILLHNQPKEQINWDELRQSLVQAEVQPSDEWE